jgi:hypothetical protein
MSLHNTRSALEGSVIILPLLSKCPDRVQKLCGPSCLGEFGPEYYAYNPGRSCSSGLSDGRMGPVNALRNPSKRLDQAPTPTPLQSSPRKVTRTLPPSPLSKVLSPHQPPGRRRIHKLKIGLLQPGKPRCRSNILQSIYVSNPKVDIAVR